MNKNEPFLAILAIGFIFQVFLRFSDFTENVHLSLLLGVALTLFCAISAGIAKENVITGIKVGLTFLGGTFTGYLAALAL